MSETYLSLFGTLPDFTSKLGTARSRDIGMTIIVQNIPQLENRYPDGQAEEIIGGCDFRILLGANDETTSTYFSNLLGTTTIKVNTDRRSVTTSLFSMKSVSEVQGSNEGSGQRNLMLADEIRRMSTDELLFFVRGEQPIKLRKFRYMDDPDALLLRAYNPADVIPDWAVKNGVYLRTGEIVEETRAQMEQRIMEDPDFFVVRDSEKWGMQRTQLINSYKRIREKYKAQGYFPNGMPLSVFDGMVTGPTKVIKNKVVEGPSILTFARPQENVKEKEVTPKENTERQPGGGKESPSPVREESGQAPAAMSKHPELDGLFKTPNQRPLEPAEPEYRPEPPKAPVTKEVLVHNTAPGTTAVQEEEDDDEIDPSIFFN